MSAAVSFACRGAGITLVARERDRDQTTLLPERLDRSATTACKRADRSLCGPDNRIMREWLKVCGYIVGSACLLGGLILIARENPIAIGSIVGLSIVGILLLTAWYDSGHWKRKFVLWRHADVLAAAVALIDPHLDRLAQDMGRVLKWDGRSDYLWSPWIVLSREFVDTTVVPALTPEQQRIIADCDPVLREEIRSVASGRVFERASRLALLK